MSKVPTKILLEDAMKRDYAIGAYAISNMEQIESIVEAANICRSPLIIMISKKSLKYSKYLAYLIDAVIKENPGIPIAMHLDHSQNFDQCREAIDFGFSSVMIDGTFDNEGKSSSFDYNLELTKKVVDYARKFGVSVEGEIGFIGGKEDDMEIDGQRFTDPQKVEEFVEYTRIDALAVSIGNSHGLNKFVGEQQLRFDILAEINEKIPKTPLVLHGASSLPEKYIQKIKEYGGSLHQVKGVPIEQVKKSIKLGIKKVNIYTDITLCMIAELREFLSKKPEVIDPREYLGTCRDEIVKLVSNKMAEFGSVDKL
jgi:fructose-bisphosphate aldolase, class II